MERDRAQNSRDPFADPDPTEGLPRTKEELVTQLRENLADLSKPLAFNDVAEILGSTVKRDNPSKILLLLDQPHDQLLQKLRSFLSHDRKEIKYKISDRSQKAGLRTKTVILVGFPSIVFCTARFDLDQQERTRVWQLSPETNSSKVDDALDLLLEKK